MPVIIIPPSKSTVVTDGLNLSGKNHPWLHYSLSEDGAYCKARTLFAPSKQKLDTLVVSKPFSLWTKHFS